MSDQQSNIKIIIQTIKQGEGDKEAQTGLTDLKGGVGDLSQEFLGINVATLGFAAALALVTKQISDDVGIAAKDQDVMASLTVTMDDLGRSSQESAPQLEKMAYQLQDMSTFDHTQIEAAYNAIAKFENVPTGSFDHIVEDAMNMSAAMGGDLASNAEMIARVLETGVIPRTWGFSVAMRTAIKDEVDAGNTTKALADILGTLDQRFGGQSAAALATYDGQVKHLDNDFKILEEDAGKKVLPPLTKLAETADLLVKGSEKGHQAAWWESILPPVGIIHNAINEIYGYNKALEDQKKAEADAASGIPVYVDDLNSLAAANDSAARAILNHGDGLDYTIPKILAEADAAEKAAQSLKDQNEVVKFATDSASEFAGNEKSMADAEAKLQTDRSAGWRDTSQKIKDDQQAIEDLKSAHTAALLQMIVDVEIYKLEQDKDLSPEDVEKKALKLQLAFGLISQAEYDATMQALALATAILGVPAAPGQGSSAKNKPGHDYGGGGYQTGLDFTVPPGFEGDNFQLPPMRVKSGERVQVQTPEQQHMQGGGGGGRGPLIDKLYLSSGLDIQALNQYLVHL